MEISYSTNIDDSQEKIWNTLSSFEGVEKYFPIVTRSDVKGKGKDAQRTSLVNIGNNEFEICESLQSLDDQNHTLTVKIKDGPIQMRGMNFTYNVRKTEEGKSDLIISTSAVNPDARFMAKSIFSLIGQGLKKFHEL